MRPDQWIRELTQTADSSD